MIFAIKNTYIHKYEYTCMYEYNDFGSDELNWG